MAFLWCPFCKNPHLLTERTCPITGDPLVTTPGKKKSKLSVEIGVLVENKYLLRTLLGNGAYGIVYAAENTKLGGQVALKFLGRQTNDAALRFQQEARIANSLQHPNICRVFDSGTTVGGTPFFVMELLTGQTLRHQMERGPLDPRRATGIITEVLSGLGAAHTKGIIHRDIKPENVFLQEREGLEPIAKILDFGLAKLPGPHAKINTAKGVALGTVLYMAPEQLLGLPVSVACDIYATALVLYEAIAGGHPFRHASHAETAAAIFRNVAAPLSTLNHACPPALDGVVARGLAKDPAARFGSARDFQAALHHALQIVEHPDDAPPRTLRMPGTPGAPGRLGRTALPNLASSDSEHDSDETGKTIPDEIYRKR